MLLRPDVVRSDECLEMFFREVNIYQNSHNLLPETLGRHFITLHVTRTTLIFPAEIFNSSEYHVYLLSQQKEQNPLDGVSIAVQEFVEQCTDKIGCVRLYFFIDLYFTPFEASKPD